MKSNCTETKHYVKEMLEAKSGAFLNNEIQNHIQKCDDCALIYNQVVSTLNEIDIIKESKPEVSAYFTEKTLSKIMLEKENSFSISRWVNSVLFKQPQILAASMVSIIIGVVFGILINFNQNQAQSESATMDTSEQAYYAGMSNTYLTQFFENQIPKSDGEE